MDVFFNTKDWTLPIVVLTCAIDSADKRLLGATYKALQTHLEIGPSQLGQLSFFQGISLSLALPIWGMLMSVHSPRKLLTQGCLLWAMSTAGLALSTSYYQHCILRISNGVALACVNPISQALLSQHVPASQRGQAFGVLTAFGTIITLATSFLATTLSQVDNFAYTGLMGWQVVYLFVSFCSVCMAHICWTYLPKGQGDFGRSKPLNLKEQFSLMKKICSIPSFCLLVLQGVAGGTPWNAFSFMTMYYQLCGFTDTQAATIDLFTAIGGIPGSLFGGWLGDRMDKYSANFGRISVAITSVILGIPLVYIILAVVPRDPSSFHLMLFFTFMFGSVATWCSVAANRPICSELVVKDHERAQIVAMWISIEGISASFFGAPVVGFLSEMFGYDPSKPGQENAGKIADAINGISMTCWGVCLVFWFLMLRTYPNDRVKAKSNGNSEVESSEIETFVRSQS